MRETIIDDGNSSFYLSNNVRLSVSAVCNLRWIDSGLGNMGDLGSRKPWANSFGVRGRGAQTGESGDQ